MDSPDEAEFLWSPPAHPVERELYPLSVISAYIYRVLILELPPPPRIHGPVLGEQVTATWELPGRSKGGASSCWSFFSLNRESGSDYYHFVLTTP